MRDLGLRVRYGLCDPCFTDLVAARTLSGPLPLSRILDDLPGGELSGAAAEPGRAAGELSGTADELDGEPDAPRPPRPPRARRSAEP
ncbi:hypothetical protein IHE55_07755 [Streptomyces pactum]|uniref:Uncharacterized protein n=1 Tax=Streptomyces pactum TaxID=68249 RepID=A0ABS0NHM3_9ACTN|nr:hypothetical protein [Streptomyces pactum]MBH5334692.1 hypothetical protein [Streptomyces pactum]